MTVIDYASRFQRASGSSGGMTPFERSLQIEFEINRHNPSLTHLCVALRYNRHSPNDYTDPQSGMRLPATVDIFTLDCNDSPAETLHIMGVYKDPIVIMLDLRGPSVADQIPGWNPGTIAFPDKFAEQPVINLRTEPLPQQPPSPRRMLGVIDGGLSL